MFNMKSKIFLLLILTAFLVGCSTEQAGDSAKETEEVLEESGVEEETVIEDVPEETEPVQQQQTIEEVAEITTTMAAGEAQLIVIKGIEHSIGVSSIFPDAALIFVDDEELVVNIGEKETVNGLQISVTGILVSSKESVSDKVEFVVKAVE